MPGRVMVKIGIVFAVVVLLTIVLVLCGTWLMKVRYGDKKEVLEAEAGASKALVVYQPSLTSAASDVAHWIAGGLNEGGYEVTLNRPGEYLSSDISGYDVIVLGGPNYRDNYPEAVFAYVDRIGDFEGKRVILFSTAGCSGDSAELDKLEAGICGTKPCAAIRFQFFRSAENQPRAHALGLKAATGES